jgi:hypothetical protein
MQGNQVSTEEKAMIQLELTTEEEQHLKEEVEKRLTELDEEIAHSDSTGFKDPLKRRRESVRNFLEKLPRSAAIANQSRSGFVPRSRRSGDEQTWLLIATMPATNGCRGPVAVTSNDTSLPPRTIWTVRSWAGRGATKGTL